MRSYFRFMSGLCNKQTKTCVCRSSSRVLTPLNVRDYSYVSYQIPLILPLSLLEAESSDGVFSFARLNFKQVDDVSGFILKQSHCRAAM